MVTDVYSHIIAEMKTKQQNYRGSLYEKKNLDPKSRKETTTQTVDVPDDVDASCLQKYCLIRK